MHQFQKLGVFVDNDSAQHWTEGESGGLMAAGVDEAGVEVYHLLHHGRP